MFLDVSYSYSKEGEKGEECHHPLWVEGARVGLDWIIHGIPCGFFVSLLDRFCLPLLFISSSSSSLGLLLFALAFVGGGWGLRGWGRGGAGAGMVRSVGWVGVVHSHSLHVFFQAGLVGFFELLLFLFSFFPWWGSVNTGRGSGQWRGGGGGVGCVL